MLNEDFLKCHVRSHVQSVLEARNSLDANSRLAKVRNLDLFYFIFNAVERNQSSWISLTTKNS